MGAHDPPGAWPVCVPFPETTAWGRGWVQEVLGPAGGGHGGVRNDTCLNEGSDDQIPQE